MRYYVKFYGSGTTTWGEGVAVATAYSFLQKAPLITFDTETTGLMPYHGDRPFALIFKVESMAYYFSFEKDEPLPEELKAIFLDPNKRWVMHNAKFDMHQLWCAYQISIKGKVWDTMVAARLEFNDHQSYSLASCGARIGEAKDDTVEKYIQEHKLWEWQTIPGKKVRRKNKFYDKVPEVIMVEYAFKDVEVTQALYEHQKERLSQIDELLPNSPTSTSLMQLEIDVTKALLNMESYGTKIDPEYCQKSWEECSQKSQEASAKFKELTGHEYMASPKLFAEIFSNEKDKWSYTEKGNPSFDSDSIKKFENPAASEILKIRNLKSRADFFAGFMFYADTTNYVHPNFNQSGTATGRLSSSEPNFQNLTNDEEAESKDLQVRKAIVPISEDYCIVSIDYNQQEYRLLLDYAGETELINKVNAGEDVHQATADMMGVSRKYAKTLNFMLLYGGGAQKLADALGVSLEEARKLKDKYFSALPKVKKLIDQIIRTAEDRGYVHNWAGRRYWCERAFAYKMPNRVIQGGGADIMKKAIVAIDSLFLKYSKKSTLFLSVHDELCFYIHKDELNVVPIIVKAMEEIYTPKNGMPLTVSVSHSWKSLADLEEGYPQSAGKKPGNSPLMSGSSPFSMGAPGIPTRTWSSPGEATVVQKILTVYGVPLSMTMKYSHIEVSFEDLWGCTIEDPGSYIRQKLAHCEYSALKYYSKEQGLDLEALNNRLYSLGTPAHA